MNWTSRKRLASYLRSSLWIIPVVAAVLEQISAAIVFAIDARLGWAGLGFGIDGAKALCGAVVTFALSFIVFTFGSLLVAIQVASGQYTPRIIATTLLRDNVIRYTVGGFVFALLFAIKALNRIETSVPQLVVFIAGVLGLICLVAFLFLIDYAARMLRPVSLVKRLGDAELRVLETMYPERLADTPSGAVTPLRGCRPDRTDRLAPRQLRHCPRRKLAPIAGRGGKGQRRYRVCAASRRFCRRR